MALPPALAPFRVRSFRFQWPADLLTSWAFEMETLILGWYVLVETGSVVFLSVFGALGYGGTLLAPMIGVVSDRIGHRAVLAGMRAIYAAVAATIAALALTGALTPILVCVLAAITGLVRPCDMGLRSALIADTMPTSHLTGALGLSRATSDTAKIAGALTGAGLFAVFGIAAAYVAIAGFYFLALLLTLGVARSKTNTAAAAIAPGPWGDLRDGLAHIWKSPALIAIVWLAFLFNGLAYPITNGLLPYAARDVYHVDQEGLGWLLASFAFGALIGSIALSRPGATRELPRLMVVSGIAWFGLLLIFGQTRHFAAGIAALMLAGFFQSLAMVAHTVLLIGTSDMRMRGRVVGVRMMAIYSLPLGLLAAGALIERIGYPATIALYGAIGMLLVALIAVRWRAFLWRPQSADEGM